MNQLHVEIMAININKLHKVSSVKISSPGNVQSCGTHRKGQTSREER